MGSRYRSPSVEEIEDDDIVEVSLVDLSKIFLSQPNCILTRLS